MNVDAVCRIAEKDFEESLRSRALWTASAVLAVLLGLIVYAAGTAGDRPPGASVLQVLTPVLVFLVPLTALVVGYRSIVGERRSGSIKLLFGLPFSRAEVLLGKVAGRTALVSVSVLVGFAVTLALLVVLVGVPSLSTFAGLLALTLLLGLAFVSLAVSISAATSTRNRAIALAMALYLLSTFLWTALATGLHWLVAGGLPGRSPPTWYLLVKYVGPTAAYTRAVDGLFEDAVPAFQQLALDRIPPSAGPEQLLETVPFFLEEWFMPLLLVLWVVLPTGLAYLRFRRADLG